MLKYKYKNILFAGYGKVLNESQDQEWSYLGPSSQTILEVDFSEALPGRIVLLQLL